MDIDPKGATREQIEQVVQAWRLRRAARLAAEKEAAKIKEGEDVLKSWLIDAFRLQLMEGVIIDGKITGLSVRDTPVIANRDKLEQFIFDTGDLSLLQFQLSVTAVNEHLSNGEEIPGVELMEYYQLYDRKI